MFLFSKRKIDYFLLGLPDLTFKLFLEKDLDDIFFVLFYIRVYNIQGVRHMSYYKYGGLYRITIIVSFRNKEKTFSTY